MRIWILQHTETTTAGSTIDWLERSGLEYRIVRFYAGDPLPDPSQVDWVIVCGGVMGANDEAEYAWMKEEKKFLKSAIDSGASALGLCLGGQLLAAIHGAEVKRHSHWEVGWHPIELSDGTILTAFQFHQDTFEIPESATRIATNGVCANQGFRVGKRVVGLQFHPEADETWIRSITDRRADDFPEGPHVHSPESILARLSNARAATKWYHDFLQQQFELARDRKGSKG